MKKMRFTSLVAARPQVVWEVMLGPETYRDWTTEFAEGSYFEGSWDEGAKIRFLGPDGQGMVARIAQSRPHESLSIEHLGVIKDRADDITSESARAWAPAYENYAFREIGGSTEITVEIDVMDLMPDFEEYMARTWPKALARLAVLCEARTA